MDKKLNLILLIDDDPNDHFLHERTIKKANAAEKIEVCLDGEEALGFLTHQDIDGKYPQPDLILLDINMSGIDGWEFLEIYIDLPDQFKRVPVMLTSPLNSKEKQRAEQFNVVKGYYSKPLTEEMLREILTTLVLC